MTGNLIKSNQGEFFRRRMYPRGTKAVISLGRWDTKDTHGNDFEMVNSALAAIKKLETTGNDGESGENIFFVAD